MSAAKLNGIVDENLEEVEIAVGIRIVMVNIDECMTPYEQCEAGGCESVLHVNATPALVNTNQVKYPGGRLRHRRKGAIKRKQN